MNGIYIEKDYPWTNAHQNIKLTVARHYDVWNRGRLISTSSDPLLNWQVGIDNLKRVVEAAEKARCSLQAVGSRWSLSPVATTTGFLLNTQPLDIAFIGLPGDAIVGPEDASEFVVTQCGATIAQLNRWLFDKGLALPTCGASDGQTFAGAMSTGTHGGAINIGSVQDYVYGVHFLTASSESVWVEGNNTVLSDEALAAFYGEGVRRINDDNTFHAALVSFGGFGVITSVLFRAERLYKLELHQKHLPYDRVKPCFNQPTKLSLLGLKDNPHHIEFVINPYNRMSVIVRVMYKIEEMALIKAPEPVYDLGVDLIEVFGQIADHLPTSVPGIMRLLDKQLKSRYPETSGEQHYPGNVFTGDQSGFRGRGVSMEIGVALSDAPRAIDLVLAVADTVSLPGAIGVRYIKNSWALLSIAKFNPTCTIEIPAAFSAQSERYFHSLWAALDKAGISYTFHWGQMNNLNAEKVLQKWGTDVVSKWIYGRRKILPTDAQRIMFCNDFLRGCGLQE